MKLLPETTADTMQLSGAKLLNAASTWRLVVWLAWPVLLQQFLILAVGLSDRFLAGHFQPVPPQQQAEALGHELAALGFLGNAASNGVASALAAEGSWQAGNVIWGKHISYQAAQTTANYLNWLISSYTVLVTVGSTALVARFVGAGDRAAAVRVTNQSVVLAAVLGMAATVAFLLSLDALIWLLQLRGDAAGFAADYLFPLVVLLTFQMLESGGIACLIGAGDTRTGLWVRGGVTLINVPLAWSFFHGIGPIPMLGFKGIALGTALSHMLGSAAVLIVLARGRAGLRLEPRLLLPDLDLQRRLLRISIPAGIDGLSVALGQLWFLSIINRLGDVASSAHGIALGWEGLGYLSGHAFGTAAMTLVGENLGARRPHQATRSGWIAFALGGGVMTLMGVVFFLLAPQMFALFCPDAEQEAIVETGVPVLRLVAFAMPALASTIIFTNALRGAGDTRIPVLFTWIGFLGVRLPLAYLLTSASVDLGVLGAWQCLDLGLFGAWLAMFADLLVRGAFFLARFAGGRWQRIIV